MEARDKKQLDEATRNEPKGMQAIVGICTFIVRFAWSSAIVQVPDQPNYCDCGIYLLHFARTFMKDPKLSSDIIRVCVADCTMWDLNPTYPFLHSVRRRRKVVGFLPTNIGTAPPSAAIATS